MLQSTLPSLVCPKYPQSDLNDMSRDAVTSSLQWSICHVNGGVEGMRVPGRDFDAKPVPKVECHACVFNP